MAQPTPSCIQLPGSGRPSAGSDGPLRRRHPSRLVLWGVVALAAFALLPSFPGVAPVSAGTPGGSAWASPGPTSLPATVPAPAATHIAAVHPSANGSVVNPYAHYGPGGPAPYGIADFGVTAADTGYRYNTTSFLGTLDISSMDASDTVVYHGKTYTIPGNTVQLNTILVLAKGSQSANYWVQNVPFFEPSDNSVEFENNIWNMSTSGDIPTNSIVGNGSIDDNSVYITSAGTQPGNDVSLSYPTNVSVKLTTGVAKGIPYVVFDYNDGYGWQTYDNATFPWAAGGWVDEGFVVDGTQYLPNSLYYDTEWVYGGPGDGLSSTNLQSNFSMSLQYFNGHNYQAVPNAFNFGSDTGESMNDVGEAASLGSGAPGIPTATLTVGNSALGMLYSSADVADVNATTQIANATVTFGSLTVPFVGNDANVTIAPGAYNVSLWSAGKVVDSVEINVTGGEYLAITLAAHPPIAYGVSFTSTGLPIGKSWSVTLGNETYTPVDGLVGLSLLNGSYPYSISPVSGYYLSHYRGVLTINGTNVSVVLPWHYFLFPVTVDGLGLPAGIPWQVTVISTADTPGADVTSITGSAVVELANGSYDYSVSVEYQYIAIVSPDTFAILGGPTTLTVDFVLRYGYLVGTVTPAAATVDVNATQISLGAGGSFNATLVPGNYNVTANLYGYQPFSTVAYLSPGNATPLSIVLVAVTPGPSGHQNTTPTNTTTGSSGPLSSNWVWIGLGVVVVAAIAAAAAAILRRRTR